MVVFSSRRRGPTLLRFTACIAGMTVPVYQHAPKDGVPVVIELPTARIPRSHSRMALSPAPACYSQLA